MGGDAPDPPDPNVQAAAQGASNVRTARVQAQLNRPNVYTPYGSTTWERWPGSNKYTQRITPKPIVERLINKDLRQSEALSDSTNDAMRRVGSTFRQGVDYDSAPRVRTPEELLASGMAATPQSDAETYQKVSDSVYNQATSRLDPRFEQAQSQMNSQLAAQGITQGSEAYNREVDNFNQAKNDAYNQAQYSATQQADSVLQNQFQRGMASAQLPNQLARQNYALERGARQDYIGEQMDNRQMLLNELNALRTGAQVNNQPVAGQGAQGMSQVGVDGVPVGQYMNQAYQGNLAGWQQDQSNRNSMIGAGASIAAAGLAF